MEKRNITLTLDKAKEWYKKDGELRQVALQAFNKEELEDNRSHSWEEFCKNHPQTGPNEFGINTCSDVYKIYAGRSRGTLIGRLIFPNKEYAEATLALAQLLQVRQEWIGNWNPAWRCSETKWCIVTSYVGEFDISAEGFRHCILSFPTNKMANEFLKDFKDLIEIAKPLL